MNVQTTPRVAKKQSNLTKPGTLNGVREIVTQTSPQWNQMLRQLMAVGKMYGFQRVETPIVEEEKVYTDFYKDQPRALEKVIFTQLGTKSLALRSAVLPSLFRY